MSKGPIAFVFIPLVDSCSRENLTGKKDTGKKIAGEKVPGRNG